MMFVQLRGFGRQGRQQHLNYQYNVVSFKVLSFDATVCIYDERVPTKPSLYVACKRKPFTKRCTQHTPYPALVCLSSMQLNSLTAPRTSPFLLISQFPFLLFCSYNAHLAPTPTCCCHSPRRAMR